MQWLGCCRWEPETAFWHQMQLFLQQPLPPLPHCYHLSLLLSTTFQAVYNTAQPDVKQPDLGVQVVNFLLKWTCPTSTTPVSSHRPRHEVHSHDEAQRQYGSLGVALKFLQDIKAWQGEKGDPCKPEETTKHSMKKVEETPQEHGEEPVGQKYGSNQEQCTCWRVGERCGAEVVRKVRGYRGKRTQQRVNTVPCFTVSFRLYIRGLTVDAHHIQQIWPDLPDSVQKRVHSMDKPLRCFGEKLQNEINEERRLRWGVIP